MKGQQFVITQSLLAILMALFAIMFTITAVLQHPQELIIVFFYGISFVTVVMYIKYEDNGDSFGLPTISITLCVIHLLALVGITVHVWDAGQLAAIYLYTIQTIVIYSNYFLIK